MTMSRLYSLSLCHLCSRKQ